MENSIERDDSRSLMTYYRQISKFKQLNHEQITLLANRMHDGDSDARKQLIHSNLRLVITIAKQYVHPKVELLDLIQEGNMGLIEAVDRYNPILGNRFSTYAIWWIRKQILLYLGKHVDDLLSLDAPLICDYDDELSGILLDSIEDKESLFGDQSYADINHNLDREDDRRLVQLMLDKLTLREREILQLLYGVGNSTYPLPVMTAKEIAHLLGVSEARISQIRDSVLNRLRSLL